MMQALHIGLLFVSLLGASVPPDAAPKSVEFPVVTVPQPAPTPQAVPTLTPGVIYPVVCRVDCSFRAYPAALVRITPEVVPAGQIFRYRGTFIDGSTEKTWKGPATIYLVEVTPGGKDGNVDLVAVPYGFKAEAEIVTASIYVDNQKKPKPPPDPIDPPKPVTKSFRVLFIYESSATVPQSQISVRDSKAVRTFLDENCTKENGVPAYRAYDKDSSAAAESPEMKALWEAVKPKITTTPCLAVEVNGKVDIIPYPATAADAVAILRKYKGN